MQAIGAVEPRSEIPTDAQITEWAAAIAGIGVVLDGNAVDLRPIDPAEVDRVLDELVEGQARIVTELSEA